MGKIPHFNGFGVVNSHSCTGKCKIWHWWVDRAKNIFGQLSKRNTSMMPCRQSCS